MRDELACLTCLVSGADGVDLLARVRAAAWPGGAHPHTGVLLLHGRRVLLAIEGERPALLAIVERLHNALDLRLKLLDCEAIKARRFQRWHVDVLPPVPGCDAPVRRFFAACEDAQPHAAAHAAVAMLEQLAQCVRQRAAA